MGWFTRFLHLLGAIISLILTISSGSNLYLILALCFINTAYLDYLKEKLEG